MAMDISLIVFPGTNREKDMELALENVSGQIPRKVWHKDMSVGTTDLIILPGGFSYGDYLRCGAMAAHSPIMKDVVHQANKGTPVLGICNGFQMLLETRLLPGALVKNKSLKFICKRTRMKTIHTDNLFMGHLEKDQILEVPVAHGGGNYFASEDQIKSLEDHNQIAFQYCNDNGDITQESNPNGSIRNIAGITNKRKTILGLMPHPEDAVLPYQSGHSYSKDGQDFFRSIIETLSA